MTSTRPLLTNNATFWFIESFLIEQMDLGLLRQNLGPLALEKLSDDESALSSYVEFAADDLLCRELSEHAASVQYPAAEDAVPCTVRHHFFFGPMGLCSHILCLVVDPEVAAGLGPHALIAISNVFETPLGKGSSKLVVDGVTYAPAAYLEQRLAKLVEQLPQPLRQLTAIAPAANGEESLLLQQRPYVATVLRFASAERYNEMFLQPMESLVAKIAVVEPGPHRTPEQWVDALRDGEALALGAALAALLYRLKTATDWYNIDFSYLRGFAATDRRGFENYHPHRDIFVTLHTRSMLVGVCTEREASQQLFGSFSSLLMATVADARAKWYASLFVNAHIDAYVAALQRKEEIDAVEVLGVLFDLRRGLISILDSTTSRRRSLSSLSEIFEQFNRMFGVAELRDQAVQKTELVEKIYQNLQQLMLYRSARSRRFLDDSEIDQSPA